MFTDIGEATWRENIDKTFCAATDSPDSFAEEALTWRDIIVNFMLARILSVLPHNKIRCHSTLGAMSNRLGQERSPYLLQHAQNPVHWFPWGEEAFQEAKGKDKPIFLSVGYSTCHWCHVMERESFENEDVAAIMNEHFVNVKVDREERPDVDKVYMAFVQATTGGGGWPMSVFLTPSLKPFFGGTYFPPDDRYGRPGFKSLLRSIAEQWRKNKEAIKESGDAIIEVMTEADKPSGVSDASLPSAEDSMAKCFTQLLKRYDPEFGGFSAAPKFPSPVNFNFLFRLYAHDPSSDRSKQALRMCLHSLEMMALGGINDHISQGFARYSTDAKWHVPHFEKMLYDQGQLTVSYAQAYQASKDEKFSRVVENIMTYVQRDLRHPMGGFFSAEDADSLPSAESDHKREGAFCVWTYDDVQRILHEKIASGKGSLAHLLCAYYHIKENGNVDPRGDPHGELKGQNVLTRLPVIADEELVERFGLAGKNQLEELLSQGRRSLFDERSKRPRPHLDDKILVSWNGLMISGCCAAASALQRQHYVETATKAALFIKEHLYVAETSVLLHSIYTKTSDRDQVEQIAKPIEGFADDYAYLVRGLLDLYEVTFDPAWLEWASRLQDKQDELFWDTEASGYFLSAAGDPSIVLRLKEDQDGVEPASNSVTASNLLRLSSFLDRSEYRVRAEQVLSANGERLIQIPMAVPELVTALMWAQQPHTQIIVTGSPETSSVTKQMIGLVQSNLVLNRILILADGNKDSFLYKNLKVMRDISADKPGLAYVCKNNTCAMPVDSVEDLAKNLNINVI